MATYVSSKTRFKDLSPLTGAKSKTSNSLLQAAQNAVGGSTVGSNNAKALETGWAALRNPGSYAKSSTGTANKTVQQSTGVQKLSNVASAPSSVSSVSAPDYSAMRSAAMAAAQQAYGAVPTFDYQIPEYQSRYQSQIDAMLDKVLNREKFTYNMNADPLYQQYRGQYMRNAKTAMEDTQAKAAALSGGYGNSYAAAAGSAAYQQGLDGLNDVALNLEQAAYQKYQNDGADMYNQLGALNTAENAEYGRYIDNANMGLNVAQAQYGAQNDAYQRAYNAYQDSLSTARDDSRYERELAMQQLQNERNYQLSLAELAAKTASAKTASDYKDTNAYNSWLKTMTDSQQKTAKKVTKSQPNLEGYIANASGHGVSASSVYEYARQAVNAGTITPEELDKLMTKYYGKR